MEKQGVIGHTPRELDQFFTKPQVASECFGHLSASITTIDAFDHIVEPSFGNGAFVDVIPAEHKHKLLCMDIDAKDALRHDFLAYDFSALSNNCLTIGNPPFGKNSSLAVKFFNIAARFPA